MSDAEAIPTHPITPDIPAGTLDVMIDLETMSTRADAAIVSIGACWFNVETGDVGDPLRLAVDLNNSRLYGGHIDGDTVRWWLRQSDAARDAISADGGVPLAAALQELQLYLHGVAELDHVRVWGDPATFDLPILSTAYGHCDIAQPWRYWNGRCLMTLRKLLPHVPEPTFQGTPHDAGDDARHQARHAIAILRELARLQPPAPTTTTGA